MTNHAIVVDLAWGDAGKGSIVDYLCESRGYRTVVRYNGGAQAAHRVVRADGREHVFRMFGSGTLAGAITILSRFVLIDPLAIAREVDLLEAIGVERPLEQLRVDENALVTTPMHASANRVEETARGGSRHGSCGRGIGKTREYAIAYPDDALYVRDLFDANTTNDKLELMVQRFGEPSRPNGMRELAAAYQRFTKSTYIITSSDVNQHLTGSPAVFEGAQGVLLDENWGFPPYYTWTDTTSANALTLLGEASIPRSDVTVMGLTRSYATRHGPGPFPTEDADMSASLPDACNEFNQWQRDWRVGRLDLVALRYAIKACRDSVDELVVTCLDRATSGNVCVGYADRDGRILQDIPRADTAFLESAVPLMSNGGPLLLQIEEYLGVPVTLTSQGPTAADKVERTVRVVA